LTILVSHLGTRVFAMLALKRDGCVARLRIRRSIRRNISGGPRLLAVLFLFGVALLYNFRHN
jgi:hypothetical protein